MGEFRKERAFARFVLDALDKLEKGRPLVSALSEAWEGSSLKAMEGSDEHPPPPASGTLPPEAPTNPGSPKTKKCPHRQDPKRCPNCLKTTPRPADKK